MSARKNQCEDEMKVFNVTFKLFFWQCLLRIFQYVTIPVCVGKIVVSTCKTDGNDHWLVGSDVKCET